MSATFYKGDNLTLIKRHIPSKSINLIYFNPPYGTTRQKWDEKLDWSKLFEEFFRILKDDGMLVIHASIPFNYTLIRAAPKMPTYTWYWEKENSTCPLISNHQPLRNTEEILVWKNKKTTYYPQRVGDIERYATSHKTGDLQTNYYLNSKCNEVILERKKVKGYLRTHHISMKREIDEFSTRPRELIELMINSYTKPGDTILDPTCFKGYCGAIAKEMGRNWIGMDKYFLPTKLMCDTKKATNTIVANKIDRL